ncbi:hypothetical protein Hoch_2612 [Haliangium ochraceum DSM 14365]|uniref:Uncharacterized protein n=2 Tax=Haliangium ochraceum TaxID=80816 RepID=D0LLW7_HALO1|nr:hypothetical protein Hoch_2612 [Haliangium ochraceum DSM 14365]
MTILEVMIVLALIGLLAGVAIRGVRWMRSSSLRETATQIAAMLRATYNAATMTAAHHRVVFNLEEQSYRIEACEGPVVLHRSDEEDVPEEDGDEGGGAGSALRPSGVPGSGRPGDLPSGLLDGLPGLPSGVGASMPRPGAGGDVPPEIASAASLEEATALATELAGSQMGGARCQPADIVTGDSDGRGAQGQLDTGSGLRITRMFVQHLDGEQREGVVYLNFFPLGYAEKAAIEIADADDTTYTLLVHALTGRVEFVDGRIDPEEHLLRRADGEEVEER